MPQTAVAHPPGTVPMETLRPWTLEKSLEKKMKGTVVYGVLMADKISTKWKKQRRMVMVTGGLVLVCGVDGGVRRVVDLSELKDIYVQPDGVSTLILFKLGKTEHNEPDLLISSVVDTKNRNSHDPISFATLVNTIAKTRNPLITTVSNLPANGHIRSLTKLGHNTVSAREKIRNCAVRQTPIVVPASVPSSTPVSPVNSIGSERQNIINQQPIPIATVTATTKTEFANDVDVIMASRQRANTATAGFSPEPASEFVKTLQQQRPRAVSFTTPKPIEVISAEPASITSAKAYNMPPVKTLPEDDEGGCGWTEHKDPVTQLTYYHNDKEGRSTWHEPEELKEWKNKTGYLTVGTAVVTKPRVVTTLTEDSAVDSDSTAEASDSDSSDDSSSGGFGPIKSKPNPGAGLTSIKQLHSLLDAPAVRVPTRPTYQQPSFETHLIEDEDIKEATMPMAFRGSAGVNHDPVRRQLLRPSSVPIAARGLAMQNCKPDFQEFGLDL